MKFENVKYAFLQVVSATPDGKEFDLEDADLQLDKGKPRYAHITMVKVKVQPLLLYLHQASEQTQAKITLR